MLAVRIFFLLIFNNPNFILKFFFLINISPSEAFKMSVSLKYKNLLANISKFSSSEVILPSSALITLPFSLNSMFETSKIYFSEKAEPVTKKNNTKKMTNLFFINSH